MSKGVGVDAEQARKISDAGSEFKIPSAPRDELRQLSREEWMARYGGELASEQHFEQKDPNWADNPNSWWHKEVGRAGSEPPLWMREQVRHQPLPHAPLQTSLSCVVKLTPCPRFLCFSGTCLIWTALPAAIGTPLPWTNAQSGRYGPSA